MVLESNTRTQLDMFRKERATKEEQIKRLWIQLEFLELFFSLERYKRKGFLIKYFHETYFFLQEKQAWSITK